MQKLKRAIALWLCPEIRDELKELEEVREQNKRLDSIISIKASTAVKMAEEIAKLNSQLGNVDKLIDTRFDIIWKRVEEYIIERYKFSVNAFDYFLRSMVTNPRSLHESTIRTYKDILAQLHLPMHTGKPDVVVDKSFDDFRTLIRIRIPPEVFTVAIDPFDLERLKPNEQQATKSKS